MFQKYLLAACLILLVVQTKAENKQQAEAKAKAALYKANSDNNKGSFTMEGLETLVAGVNINLTTGWGKFAGTWHIEDSSHTVTRSGGYETTPNIKKVK